MMPLTWEDRIWHGEMSQEGFLGSNSYGIVHQNCQYPEPSRRWIWNLSGLPRHPGVPTLGYAESRKEAKKAANEAFDQWLKNSGLTTAS
jgi:hypothetical protein